MIYVLTTNIMVPGKMNDFYGISTKELNPLYPRLGMNQIGSFHAYTGNMNQTYSLFVYDDLAAIQKARAAQQKDKDYQIVSAKLNVFRVNLTNTILEPNPWSPMK